MNLTLYHYWRSSCSWRIRWALFEKKIQHKLIPVDLVGGESQSDAHLARNPLGFVPALAISGFDQNMPQKTQFLVESVAIFEWLEEEFTDSKSLLPGNSSNRAFIRQLAEVIASSTQPVQNLSVQNAHSDNPDEKKNWAKKFIARGLNAYETLASKTAGQFSVGDEITWADLCLLPQLYNAHRFGVELEPFPTIRRIENSAIKTEGYKASEPSQFEPK